MNEREKLSEQHEKIAAGEKIRRIFEGLPREIGRQAGRMLTTEILDGEKKMKETDKLGKNRNIAAEYSRGKITIYSEAYGKEKPNQQQHILLHELGHFLIDLLPKTKDDYQKLAIDWHDEWDSDYIDEYRENWGASRLLQERLADDIADWLDSNSWQGMAKRRLARIKKDRWPTDDGEKVKTIETESKLIYQFLEKTLNIEQLETARALEELEMMEEFGIDELPIDMTQQSIEHSPEFTAGRSGKEAPSLWNIIQDFWRETAAPK